jgi:threonylcarbamoyladenosine tRNA methylthiotransferase MtaB
MKGVEIVTFGCRLNSYESEVMRSHASAGGLDDAVVFNTCAVTGEAVRQARQAIRRARRERPDARIVVTGCAAQTDPGRFAAMPEVDRVLGNAEKLQAESWRKDHQGTRVQVSDIMTARSAAGSLIDGLAERTRAIVQVQNGCDHRCTFCIIPFGRGNSRSVPAETVVEQVKRLVASGYAEAVLTGVDLTSWGNDLEGAPRLGSLVRRILRAVPDLRRLRLSSIDSIEADPELIETIGGEARLMPHLHLSLQSGDDMILKRMKRRHGREHSIGFCETLRKARSDIVFGADIIAGFPTETDEMFENSVRIVEECGLTFLHVFPFSPRPGTAAARMPQLEPSLVRERAAVLRAEGERQLERFLAREVGAVRQVLIETGTTGRSPHFAQVRFAQHMTPGAIVHAHITGHGSRHLDARLAA